MDNLELKQYHCLLNKYFKEYQDKCLKQSFLVFENFKFDQVDDKFAELTMDQLAIYADYVTTKMCDQTEFIEDKQKFFDDTFMLASIITKPELKKMNTCALSNFAKVCQFNNRQDTFNEFHKKFIKYNKLSKLNK
jgi:hypothetical protein